MIVSWTHFNYQKIKENKEKSRQYNDQIFTQGDHKITGCNATTATNKTNLKEKSPLGLNELFCGRGLLNASNLL